MSTIPASSWSMPTRKTEPGRRFSEGGSEANALNEVTFEITSTGCGQCQMTFYRQPDNAQLDYMQRIDIHLYGDRKPWYSGYIISLNLLKGLRIPSSCTKAMVSTTGWRM